MPSYRDNYIISQINCNTLNNKNINFFATDDNFTNTSNLDTYSPYNHLKTNFTIITIIVNLLTAF